MTTDAVLIGSDAAEWEELAAAGDRLSLLTGARAGAGRRFVALLREGRGVADAAVESGAPAALRGPLAQAPTEALPVLLGELGDALDRSTVRRRQVQGALPYPLLLAAACIVLAVLVGQAAPSFAPLLARPQDALAAPHLDAGLSHLALGVAAIALVVLAALVRVEVTPLPFSRARRSRDTALVLSMAATLARRGVALDVALRSAAETISGSVRTEVEAVAAGLARGTAEGAGARLFGSVGAGIFAASAAEGAGAVSLSALAAIAEREAARDAPRLAFQAEIVTLVVAGSAMLVVAVSFITTYAAIFGGGR